MRDVESERLAAVAGIGSVAVLAVVAGLYLALGNLPSDYDTPLTEARAFFAEHRTAVLVAETLNALSLVAFLWFLTGLRSRLTRAGEDTAGLLALANGTVFVAISLIELAAILAIAVRLSADPTATSNVRVLWELYHLLIGVVALFPLAALLAAVTLAAQRSRALPSRVNALGALAAVVNLALIPGVFATKGIYAPDSTLKHVAGDLSVQAWVLAASVALLSSARRRRADARAA